MPYFLNIKIEKLRNLQSVELIPNRYVNIIYGENGSGKTSLLEALSVIGHGRSFRTRKFQYVINKDEPSYTLFAQIDNSSVHASDSPKPLKIGVLRNRQGGVQIKVDGEKIMSAGKLAQSVPMLVIDGHSFQLLEGAAKERRQFFDWLVFHVEHSFGDQWKQYTKCLKQRNSLLRHDKIEYGELAPWDSEIARVAALIESARAECFEVFKKALNIYLTESEFGESLISVEYKSGWKAASLDAGSLAEELKASFYRDKAVGYTNIGCHKADLVITAGGKKSSETLSRGQQKVLVAALFFTKAQVYSDIAKREPVFLLDDLPAELDQRHQKLVAGWLARLGSQSFITAIEKDSVQAAWPNITSNNSQLFHVEQGVVTRMS